MTTATATKYRIEFIAFTGKLRQVKHITALTKAAAIREARKDWNFARLLKCICE